MVLKFLLLVITFLFISCGEIERDNPYDPKGVNYIGDIPPSSQSEPSSNSATSSSSSVAPSSSSIPSSSSSVEPSSSSVPPSSSSIQTGIIPGEPVDYEDETYETVVIGNQTWMAKNLNYAVEGSRCYGDNTGGDSQNRCDTYGRLYNWATAMGLQSTCNSSTCASQVGAKHRGICPSGWHIPSDAEWTTLTNFVGGASTAGKYLKATSGWNSSGNGQDKYGFAALPGGSGYSGGSFIDVGNYGYWWSASEGKANGAYGRGMGYNNEYVFRDGNYKSDGLFSVRCLQD